MVSEFLLLATLNSLQAKKESVLRSGWQVCCFNLLTQLTCLRGQENTDQLKACEFPSSSKLQTLNSVPVDGATCAPTKAPHCTCALRLVRTAHSKLWEHREEASSHSPSGRLQVGYYSESRFSDLKLERPHERWVERFLKVSLLIAQVEVGPTGREWERMRGRERSEPFGDWRKCECE